MNLRRPETSRLVASLRRAFMLRINLIKIQSDLRRDLKGILWEKFVDPSGLVSDISCGFGYHQTFLFSFYDKPIDENLYIDLNSLSSIVVD